MKRGKNNSKRESNVDISGQWATNWGIMKLYQHGDKVTGSYEWDNGKIEGTVKGYNFKGYWSEPPNYDCPNHKGEFDFQISITGQSFKGSWSYCDLMKSGEWMGMRANRPVGVSVDGSWGVNDGILLLEQGSGKIDGTYIPKLNGNPIRLYGEIVRDYNLNKFIVNGEWIKLPTYECPDDRGKLYMEFDIPVGHADLYLLGCDESIGEAEKFIATRIAGPKPLNVSGAWNTNVGRMEFTQDEGIVIGSYKKGKAIIEGRIIGNVLIGKWYQAPAYGCPYDSGDIQITFTTNAIVFEGYWSYCNEDFSSDKRWEGVRVD